MLFMQMMIFAVKVSIFLSNLVFLEIVCYVFFMLVVILRFSFCYFLCRGGYFASFRALRRPQRHISKMVKFLSLYIRVYDVVMLPTNGTKHRTVSLLTKKSIKSSGSVVSRPHRGIKNSTKSGQSKPRKKNNALRPYPTRRFMDTVIFCRFAMCQKFPLFVRRKTQCN